MTLREPVVFVVDDDPAAREGVAAVAESMGAAARTFKSGEEFLAAYDPSLHGCIVSDVRMLGMSGLDLLVHLTSQPRSLPVILITAYADVPLAVRAMRQGAYMLLEKPCRSTELWEAIRGGLEADAARRRREVARRGRTIPLTSLTDEERKIIDMLMNGKTNKAMALELDVSLRTIESRRSNLFQKLQVDSVAQLVRLIVESEREAQADQ